MTQQQEEKIKDLEAEVARLNAQIIDSILPALKDSTLAVTNAFDLAVKMQAWFDKVQNGRVFTDTDNESITDEK